MKVFVICDPHLSSASPSSRLDDYPTSILDKINEVYKKTCASDIVVFAGDTFHTAAQPDYIKKALIRIIKSYEARTFFIIGNHDVLYYKVDTMEKVSLGLVAESVPSLEGVSVELSNGFYLYGLPFGGQLSETYDEKTIVVGHALYNRDDKLTLSQDKLRVTNAWAVVLGHDHSQYPIIQESGTFLLRPGALSRGTSAADSYERVISVAVIDTESEVVYYEPVNCLSAEAIFKTGSKPKKKSIPTFSEIQAFVQKLKEVNVNKSPYDILYSFNLDPAVHQRTIQYLTDAGLHKENLPS